ncbi:hypothetical protein IAU60_003705 [Kwoniella sp. DSM 27419]
MFTDLLTKPFDLLLVMGREPILKIAPTLGASASSTTGTKDGPATTSGSPLSRLRADAPSFTSTSCIKRPLSPTAPCFTLSRRPRRLSADAEYFVPAPKAVAGLTPAIPPCSPPIPAPLHPLARLARLVPHATTKGRFGSMLDGPSFFELWISCTNIPSDRRHCPPPHVKPWPYMADLLEACPKLPTC